MSGIIDGIKGIFGYASQKVEDVTDYFAWRSPPVLILMFINMILLIVVIVKVAGKITEGFMQPNEKITMYYVPWCQYCKIDLPAFENMQMKYGAGISFVKVDCMANPVTGIDGYPTYIAERADGTKVPWNGAFRSEAAMETFIRKTFDIDEYEKQQILAQQAALAAQQGK